MCRVPQGKVQLQEMAFNQNLPWELRVEFLRTTVELR